MKIHLLFWFIADIAIWFGVYFISAKLHTERAKNENVALHAKYKILHAKYKKSS